ncbi:MAG: M20/M25/M40 family metallo-hydrolase [Myxococcales bacterium]|nr:M20/M25/M40 family metallo-hydrolase [Myxococcales bacterium]
MVRRTSALACATILLTIFAGGCPEEAPPPKTPAPKPVDPGKPIPTVAPVAGEVHLTDVLQLTLEGENAEAYWAFDGSQLILQARKGDNDCDRIFRMPVFGPGGIEGGKLPTPVPVSSGKGVTTCSYFLPGNQDVIYASTHLGGDACPPKPDHSLGYVWALYDTYDIFRAKADGTGVVRLTDQKGYDAEATVCGKDGSIVFTSVRDGDIELYRMDADGKNVKRLTSTPGYDGGAFFNADCSKIVWRASRPRPGKELDDFKSLLARGLVRPSKLELMIANADGSDAQQLTYLDAASFAPYWHPSQKRILFSSNYGDPKGREFDIWAIDTDGTNLERITHAPGFDGFPMFSPDGKHLAFSSNRATPPGKHDTNVFVATWSEAGGERKKGAADRVMEDVAWLADPARQGRGVGTKGLEESGAYIRGRLTSFGFKPVGDGGTYDQKFPVVTEAKAGPKTKIEIDGKALAAADYAVLGYSPAKADVRGDLVFAGYGVVAKEADVDDYGKLDVKGKVVVVRRFVPESDKLKGTEAQRRYGDIRRKAWTAKQKGAVGLVVVDDPVKPASAPADWKQPDEAKLPPLQPEGYSDAGLPVVVVKRAIGAPLVAKLEKKQRATAHVAVEISTVSQDAFNVVARLEAEPADGKKLPGVIVVGAHYDHLGMGGRHSLAPHSNEAHVGADDNASGVAVVLEIALALSQKKKELHRDVVFALFSGEESGVLGSAHFVRAAAEGKKGAIAPKDVFAMLNLDMVGRMRENRLQVLGSETASEWPELVAASCGANRVECAASGDGYGPSDQMSFYTAGVPVLHFFTGTHTDYHKPSDVASKVNAAGAAQTGKVVAAIAESLAGRDKPLTYKQGVEGPVARGDMRSFNASLGTIPDYGGPGPGKKGVLLSGVRPGSAADKGGMKRGDVLVKLGAHDIASVEDLMFVLNASKPGETVPAVVQRDGKEVKLEVTFQESQRPK